MKPKENYPKFFLPKEKNQALYGHEMPLYFIQDSEDRFRIAEKNGKKSFEGASGLLFWISLTKAVEVKEEELALALSM